MDEAKKPTCFITMPITTHESEAETYGDPEHWSHVMETVFVEAIEQAGFKVVRPSVEGSDLIHARIIEQLINADLGRFIRGVSTELFNVKGMS